MRWFRVIVRLSAAGFAFAISARSQPASANPTFEVASVKAAAPGQTGPPSMASEHYDIAAKIPPNTSPEDFRVLMQGLLVDRLGLVVHHETRLETVYDLVRDPAPNFRQALR
jgi:hypothetical protein